MHGNPWSGQGSDAVPARLLTCAVISTLYVRGWVICLTTDISKKEVSL